MHNYKKTGETPSFCFYTVFHQSPPTQRCCFGRLSHKTIKSSRTLFDLHTKQKKSSFFLCSFKIKHYLCIAIEENKSEIRKIVLWCNGSTSVSGTACQGSSPCKTTKNIKLSCGVMVAHQFLALLVRVRVLAGQLKKRRFFKRLFVFK